jgi:hypothetical protein
MGHIKACKGLKTGFVIFDPHSSCGLRGQNSSSCILRMIAEREREYKDGSN